MDPHELLDALKHATDLSAWEQSFIENVIDQYEERGGTLTEVQQEKLEEIYESRVLGKRSWRGR